MQSRRPSYCSKTKAKIMETRGAEFLADVSLTAATTTDIVFDSKANGWLFEYFVNGLVILNPDTVQMTEYKLLLKNRNPYEVSVDGSDDIWQENATYESFVQFEAQTKKFTY